MQCCSPTLSRRRVTRDRPAHARVARIARVALTTAVAVALLDCGRAPATISATAAVPLASPPSVTPPRAVIDADALGRLAEPLYGARLPERIADSTYWRMVREFSEPGGYFRSENFVSNEMSLQHVIRHLQTLTPAGGVYVGVGPEQNFTYLGSLQPRIAFVVDIRRQNLLQHLWYKALFELSPTRAAFLSRLFSRALPVATDTALAADSLITLLNLSLPNGDMFRHTFDEARTHLVVRHGFTLDSSDLATLRYVDSVFVVSGPSLNYSSGTSGQQQRGGFGRMPTFAQVASATDAAGVNRGFLGSEATYRLVRDMQRRNLVIPLVGDFAGPKALRTLGAWLRERGARVNVFYTSNVEQYLFDGADTWSRFYANVATMPFDSTSRFIRSATNGRNGRGFAGGGAGGLMQQLTSSMVDVVRGVQTGTVREYADVLNLSRP